MSFNAQEFTALIAETKHIVLAAVRDNLYTRYSFAIDDIVQETYLRAYRGLTKNQFRAEAKFSTWLYTIARNETYRMNQKLRRQELGLLDLVAALQQYAYNPDQHSLIPEIRRFIAGLSVKHKPIF